MDMQPGKSRRNYADTNHLPAVNYILPDDDECTLDTSRCGGGASCVNTPGSYACLCPPGKQTAVDQRTCEGIVTADLYEVCLSVDFSQHRLSNCSNNATFH